MRYRNLRKRVRLALTSGHVAFVGDEWVELDSRFQQAAILAGCEIEQSHVPAVKEDVVLPSPQAVTNVDDESVIRRALIRLIERSEEGDFTSTGLPNIRALEKLAGIEVNKGEVYRIFRDLQSQASEASS